MMDQQLDIAVVGGGIVGLSTAMHLSRRFPRLRLAVLEKERGVGQHQSGHNSGVIHSGIYYKPGSLKARLCVEGAAAMVAFCREHGIPHRICGKIIVAANQDEISGLDSLLERGRANGIAGLKRLEREQAREIEPHCGGVAWLLVPGTGITDYGKVCEKYSELITRQGSSVHTSAKVERIARAGNETILETERGSFRAQYVVNCAGLHSDQISRMAGEKPAVSIIPFRGEYYDVVPERQNLIRGLIYPVPDLRFPFLGVHFTPRIGGGVDAGPNAVLALKREGYKKTDIDVRDLVQTLAFPGFWHMAARYWRSGIKEAYRSLHKSAFVEALQKLVPEIRSPDLIADGSGVRAQAVRADGSLVDDFQFICAGNMLHVWNVPSPAATASLPIGREISAMAEKMFDLR
jgi:(S)-2-hydroxyglutarate dehydrogenase